MDRRPRATSEELSQELSGRQEAPDVEIEVDRNVFPYERYIPLGRLGHGSTGEVYLCRDRLLDKKVAVKTLRVVTAEQLIAFQLEAKATSALSHPNIVTILDFGATESGAPYMVLEFVRGESLENILARQKNLPWQSVLQLIIQLSSALSYAQQFRGARW